MLAKRSVLCLFVDDCANDDIPLPNVTGKILSKAIEYCNKHDKASKSDNLATTGIDDYLKAWDADFVKKSSEGWVRNENFFVMILHFVQVNLLRFSTILFVLSSSALQLLPRSQIEPVVTSSHDNHFFGSYDNHFSGCRKMTVAGYAAVRVLPLEDGIGAGSLVGILVVGIFPLIFGSFVG
ncbi:hypothetical protein CUMW_206540 [Citrus unshiu]|nr:hypothetical protein CUMW_206540 [Citrus unshiu]